MGHRGGKNGGGQGPDREPPDKGKGKKNSKSITSSQKKVISDTDPRGSNEDFSRAADLDTIRQQAQQETQPQEALETETPECGNLLAAPGDVQRSKATSITKRPHGEPKRRRNSVDSEMSIQEEIFASKSVLEQTIIVVNNLHTEIEETGQNYLKEQRAIRAEIKSLGNDIEAETEKYTRTETLVMNLSKKIEEQSDSLEELKIGIVRGKQTAQEITTTLNTLRDMVVEQNIKIAELTTRGIDLIDTADIQQKINEITKKNLKPITEMIITQANRVDKVTQSRCSDIANITSKLRRPEQAPISSYPPTTRNTPNAMTYADTAKKYLPPGVNEVSRMYRKDYATFPDGNLKWKENWEPAKPPLTEQQKKRNKTKWEKDREKTDKEIIVFGIPTRDSAGNLHKKEYDNAQIKRLLIECARGGFYLKPGDITGSIRQIKNDRHPDYLPITVTVKDKETAEKVLEAASNIRINGSRREKPGDKESGIFGFLRPSLTEQERKAIKERKKFKDSPAGRGQAEIRKRQYESRTDAEEWAELVTEEDDVSPKESIQNNNLTQTQVKGSEEPSSRQQEIAKQNQNGTENQREQITPHNTRAPLKTATSNKQD